MSCSALGETPLYKVACKVTFMASRHKAEEWQEVIRRMVYRTGSYKDFLTIEPKDIPILELA